MQDDKGSLEWPRLVWLVVFVATWIYCVEGYGFLLGFGLGWLPSAILAAIAWLVATSIRR